MSTTPSLPKQIAVADNSIPYILTYKNRGLLQVVMFKAPAAKRSAELTKDCQTWCRQNNYTYLSYHPAYVDLYHIQPDISELKLSSSIPVPSAR